MFRGITCRDQTSRADSHFPGDDHIFTTKAQQTTSWNPNLTSNQNRKETKIQYKPNMRREENEKANEINDKRKIQIDLRKSKKKNKKSIIKIYTINDMF